MGTGFKEFMDEVWAKTKAEGPKAIEEFDAYFEHFELARMLIELRQQEGWTQRRLAVVSGVQQSEISRIERGEGNPTYRTLAALARALQVRVRLERARPGKKPDRGTRKLPVLKSKARPA